MLISTEMNLLIVSVLLALTVDKSETTTTLPQRTNCSQLLTPIDANEILRMIFSGRWILQEAYSSDPIDQYALTHSKSSWAEFRKEPNGSIYLHMSHMLSLPNRNGTTWCVYHHFPDINLRGNKLYLYLPKFNASATFQFLKACNECLVMTAKAFVPGYPLLDYLLAYGLYPKIDEFYLRPTRKQAFCKNLMPPPPFKYEGGEFCPNDGVFLGSRGTPEMDLKGILLPPWSLFTNPMALSRKMT